MAARRSALALLATLAIAGPTDARPPVEREIAAPVSIIDSQVIGEINFARTRPGDYAELLRKLPGTAATRDAIGVLDQRMPAPPLTMSPGLTAAALRHASDLGPTGGLGHIGSDGSNPGDRMRHERVFSSITAEELSLGQGSARDVVRQLIIDEGVPMRGHRMDLLDPMLRLAGVGCAPHRLHHIICVIDLASPPPPP
ncbi:MAG: CAP domain-containing protein [Caulobacterales bacterium]